MSQNYTVQEASFDHQFQTKRGDTMFSYNVTLVDAAGNVQRAYTNRKDSSPAPIVGETLYGYFDDDKLGNPKFTVDYSGQPTQPAPSPQAPGQQAAPVASPAPSTQYRQEDPEKQKLIVMQNALTNAVANASARSQAFSSQGKHDEAERVLKPSAIAVFQMWFYKASMGEWKPDVKPGEALELLGYTEEDIRNFAVEVAKEVAIETARGFDQAPED